MTEPLRNRLRRVGSIAEGVSFAADVLSRTGMLSALSPSGILSFAKVARGGRPGPHTAVMLHARNKPEKIAIVDGRRRYRYADFEADINRLAAGLAGLGIGSGDRVALMLPNCAEYIIAQQALLRLGALAVQVGYRLKGAEIAYILENAEPGAAIVHRDYLPQWNEGRQAVGTPVESSVVVVGAAAGQPVSGVPWEDLLRNQDGSRPPRATAAGGGVIIYTSGTTGKPKGATRDMGKTGLEAVGDMMASIGMSHDDRHLVVCPLYHSAAPAFAGMMLSLGGTLVIVDHFEPEKILDVIARERVTSSFMVPTMLVRLTQVEEKVRRKYDTSSLRWILSGAAPLATETARRFQEMYGKVLWNFYGSTETGLVTMAGPDDHTARPGTVGRLLRGNQMRLLDDDGAPVPSGEVGELYVRNSMLIAGYHRDGESTRKAQRDGFFSVGDLARVDADGYVYLESRKHDMVISGGVNIYPREIEDHLHTHPDILEAAVVGVPDPEWGESLKAFIVKRPGAGLAATDVIEHCRTTLADYKRPRAVEFLDALPRNPTGKVLKRELRGK